MAYNEKAILRDVNKQPVPQYWNPETQQYEVVEGKNGMLKAILIDSNGNDALKELTNIQNTLDRLLEVVK